MTAQQLKNSILQMAVQGKLVPQDPNDESASVLLERIRVEKERLIREKKIKREKNPSVIFRGPDNTPYEKVGDTITPLEVPFEIPESWEWVRLGELFQHNTGKALNGANRSGQLQKYITTSNLYWDRFELDNLKEMHFTETEIDKCTVVKGDLLVCEGGDIGRAAIWPFDYTICIQNHIHRLRAFLPLCTRFFYYLFDLYKHAGWIGGKGIAIQGLSSNAIHTLLFPLPPLSEQYRITTALDVVQPQIESYAKIQTVLNNLNTSFPDALKKSILQQAVQGKLVPQDPADEPAEVLLKRIRAEKQRLVKEGKIKKDKHESVIFRRDNSHYELVDGVERCIDEELPFEIPESWMWDRLGNVFSLQAGKNIQASEIEEAIFDGAFLCYGGNGIRGYVGRFNREGDYPIIGRQGALCGNINRATGKFYATEHAVCVETFCNIDVDWTCLFLNALNLNQYATATAQPGLAVAKINQVLIPVPPLSEQHRIAAKIEELLPLTQSI